LGFEGAELSITLVDDETIARLNAQWRQVEGPTDVLAFPMDQAPEEGPPPRVLGDIVISVERALEQAAQEGHSLEREMEELLVHGLLHLVGYDHQEPREAERMARRQAELVSLLGQTN
jgi:probable rRNA maturation factor